MVLDQKGVDFIQKWIFPGGFLPTISYLMESIRVGSKNTLVVDSVSNIGVSGLCNHLARLQAKNRVQPHYARTLREWRRRFLANFDDKIGPALRAEHPEMTDADIEVFKRKWICE
jgi:cyclopropane-fatty-acyl-phospholipid synthase